MMTESFLPREIIALMNRDNPTDWRKGGIIMDELSHHRILGNDEIISVLLHHFSNQSRHPWRVVGLAEVGRNRRGEKIPSDFQKGAFPRIRDKLEIMTERPDRRDIFFVFFAGKGSQ
jgi:hypothetical protein